jgi:hypothetical protein
VEKREVISESFFEVSTCPFNASAQEEKAEKYSAEEKN